MTLAIADHSGDLSAAWPWQVYAAIAVALIVCAAIRERRRNTRNRVRYTSDDLSNLDRMDGVSEGQPACWNTGPRGGHYVRPLGNYWHCPACGSTWPRNNTEPYDREAGDVVAAAERIARGESA